MRFSRVIASGALAALGLLACEDSKEPVAVAPTAAAPTQSALTPDGGPNMAVAIGNQIASICKAYRKKSVQAKADLKKNPTDAQLQADVKALDEMIADACN